MTSLTDRVYARYWRDRKHPYRLLRERLAELVTPGMTVVDAGCGYTAPTLRELRGRGARLIGVDVVPLEPADELELLQGDIAAIPVADGSVDLMYSRSVMEHVVDPDAVYAEAARILKPGGRWVFLTANRWDYVSLVSRAVPNRFHGAIVRRFEGRDEVDVFPTAYRTNDRGQIDRHAARAGLIVDRFSYESQYPSMFMGNGAAFWVATQYERLLMAVDALAPLRGWLFVEIVKPAA